jgi:hypothetical protein
MLEVELLAAPGERLTVRGNILDLRKTGMVPLLSDLQNAGFVHHMQLSLTVEAETGLVEQVRIEQPYVAIEASAASGGECCRDPSDRLLALEGEHLVPGFEKHVSRLFGGPLGCSHLMTLGQTVGRALPCEIAEERAKKAEREPGERIFKRTVFVDGLASPDGAAMELVLQQSDLATTPRTQLSQPLERLDRQHEVQARAVIRMNGLELQTLGCEERSRGFADVGAPSWNQWHDRADELGDLVGERIMPGFGSRLLAKFGQSGERRRLLDALLHLGPGFLQCIAALGDGGLMLAGGTSSGVEDIGGNRDACYMWRSSGALGRTREGDEA